MTIERILPFSHRQIEPLAVNQGRQIKIKQNKIKTPAIGR